MSAMRRVSPGVYQNAQGQNFTPPGGRAPAGLMSKPPAPRGRPMPMPMPRAPIPPGMNPGQPGQQYMPQQGGMQMQQGQIPGLAPQQLGQAVNPPPNIQAQQQLGQLNGFPQPNLALQQARQQQQQWIQQWQQQNPGKPVPL